MTSTSRFADSPAKMAKLLPTRLSDHMEKIKIGIIGGSGLYQMPELQNVREMPVDTPFGKPSDAFIVGELEGVEVAFLPRHGRGHRLLPTELPFRANIYATKLLGVEYILSVSAVGSLQEKYAADGHGRSRPVL